RELDRALVGEVEIVDGFQERKTATRRESPDPRLLTVRDFLSDEDREEVTTAPCLLLGASDHVAPVAARVGEVKALEQRIDVDVGGVHEKSSCCMAAPSAPRWVR